MGYVMVERRREPRRRCVLGGAASFNRRQSAMDCMVRNLSDGGALVVFPHAAITPGELTLRIPHRGELHAARIVWRSADRAGLALTPLARDAAPLDASLRIRALMAENRRLKRQLDPGSW